MPSEHMWDSLKGCLVKIFGSKVTLIVWLDVGRVFRSLIKKLISELASKPRDESFEAFDRIISTC